MNNTKFSINALLIVVLIFSIILFFFTIVLYNMADPSVQNEYYPIEGTDLAIRYSNLDPNGIYKGSENNGVLVLEGSFGADWGVSLEDDCLILNEYARTSVGMVISQIVKVDINTYKKEVLCKDAIIRGKCASGELVCLGGYVMPISFPQTNSLMKFYSMSSGVIKTEGNSAEVMFMDPGSADIVFSLRDDKLNEKTLTKKYITPTLDEIRGEAAA